MSRLVAWQPHLNKNSAKTLFVFVHIKQTWHISLNVSFPNDDDEMCLCVG